MYKLTLLILCAVNLLVITMCVHPSIIGFDELHREVLETSYNYDFDDDCDYIELNLSVKKDNDTESQH